LLQFSGSNEDLENDPILQIKIGFILEPEIMDIMHRSDVPRILISGSTYSTDNGQGVFTVNLSQRLAERDVQVAALIVSPDGKYKVEQEKGVTLYNLESIPVEFIRKGERYSFFPIRSIRKAFDEYQPDLVHIQDHFPLSMLVYAEARRRGIRTMGTNHFLPENLAPFIPFYQAAPKFCAWVLWRWMMVLYNRFQLVTTQSKAAATILKQNGLVPPVVTVSCGVDVAQFFPDVEINRVDIRKRYNIDPNRKVLLYVGRLDREKRLSSVIEALHLLNRSDIQLVLAGKGKEVDYLKSMAEKLCQPDQVVFPGYIPLK
jgi:1,2-diacylglycerol 3-alpha-glucosyltransferase